MIPTATIERASALRRAGYTQEQIAKAVGISRTSVVNYLSGIVPPQKRHRVPDEIVARAADMRRAGYSQEAIAAATGMGRATVIRRLRGIPTKKRARISADVVAKARGLRAAGATVAEICREAGIAWNTCLKYVRDIPVAHGFIPSIKPTPISLPVDALAYLDGLLIGDGSCVMASESTARLVIGQMIGHADWIDRIRSDIAACGIGSVRRDVAGHERVRKTGKLAGRLIRCSPVALACTKPYGGDLLGLRRRWYPDGIKIVPRNFDVANALTLALWHMGDGCLFWRRSSQGHVHLATNGFTEDDVRWLAAQMSEKLAVRPKVNLHYGRPTITLYNESAERFLDLVRPHVVPSFAYKVRPYRWNPVKPRTPPLSPLPKPASWGQGLPQGFPERIMEAA
jgi:transcriptional regulator with XRE-family HTH domain